MVFPQIDHYIGRTVQVVKKHELGWSIVLDGDIEVVVTDPVTEINDNIEGLALMRQDLSREGTTLVFGDNSDPFQQKVIFRPDRYAISNPSYNEGQLVNPQQPVESAHVRRVEGAYAPSAPGERVAEGPDDDFLASQEGVGEPETAADDDEELI